MKPFLRIVPIIESSISDIENYMSECLGKQFNANVIFEVSVTDGVRTSVKKTFTYNGNGYSEQIALKNGFQKFLDNEDSYPKIDIYDCPLQYDSKDLSVKWDIDHLPKEWVDFFNQIFGFGESNESIKGLLSRHF